MQTTKSLLSQILILFDGEGTGASGESAAPAAGEPTGEAAQNAAGSDTTSTPEITPEERAKAFNDLIRGEYKDLYNAEVQKIVKSRLKGTDEMKQQLTAQQDIIDRLAAKYGETDLGKIADAIDHDTALWEHEADEAGMTTEQYMQMQNLQRQNAQLIRAEQERFQQAQVQQQVQQWVKEAEELQQKYPGFDLDAELQNPQFLELMSFKDRNYSMEHVYKMCHVDDLISSAAQTSAAQTEKAVTDNIRARGSRPVENGAAQGHGAFSMTRDYKNMSLAQITDIANQIKSGKLRLNS